MSSGCTWRGIYLDARSHHQVCVKLEVECGNDGCHYKCAREQMPQHSNACMKKVILCPDCKKSVTQDVMDRHRSSLCFHARVLCPLGCGTRLPRYDVRILKNFFMLHTKMNETLDKVKKMQKLEDFENIHQSLRSGRHAANSWAPAWSL